MDGGYTPRRVLSEGETDDDLGSSDLGSSDFDLDGEDDEGIETFTSMFNMTSDHRNSYAHSAGGGAEHDGHTDGEGDPFSHFGDEGGGGGGGIDRKQSLGIMALARRRLSENPPANEQTDAVRRLRHSIFEAGPPRLLMKNLKSRGWRIVACVCYWLRVCRRLSDATLSPTHHPIDRLLSYLCAHWRDCYTLRRAEILRDVCIPGDQAVGPGDAALSPRATGTSRQIVATLTNNMSLQKLLGLLDEIAGVLTQLRQQELHNPMRLFDPENVCSPVHQFQGIAECTLQTLGHIVTQGGDRVFAALSGPEEIATRFELWPSAVADALVCCGAGSAFMFTAAPRLDVLPVDCFTPLRDAMRDKNADPERIFEYTMNGARAAASWLELWVGSEGGYAGSVQALPQSIAIAVRSSMSQSGLSRRASQESQQAMMGVSATSRSPENPHHPGQTRGPTSANPADNAAAYMTGVVPLPAALGGGSGRLSPGASHSVSRSPGSMSPTAKGLPSPAPSAIPVDGATPSPTTPAPNPENADSNSTTPAPNTNTETPTGAAGDATTATPKPAASIMRKLSLKARRARRAHRRKNMTEDQKEKEARDQFGILRKHVPIFYDIAESALRFPESAPFALTILDTLAIADAPYLLLNEIPPALIEALLRFGATASETQSAQVLGILEQLLPMSADILQALARNPTIFVTMVIGSDVVAAERSLRLLSSILAVAEDGDGTAALPSVSASLPFASSKLMQTLSRQSHQHNVAASRIGSIAMSLLSVRKSATGGGGGGTSGLDKTHSSMSPSGRGTPQPRIRVGSDDNDSGKKLEKRLSAGSDAVMTDMSVSSARGLLSARSPGASQVGLSRTGTVSAREVRHATILAEHCTKEKSPAERELERTAVREFFATEVRVALHALLASASNGDDIRIETVNVMTRIVRLSAELRDGDAESILGVLAEQSSNKDLVDASIRALLTFCDVVPWAGGSISASRAASAIPPKLDRVDLTIDQNNPGLASPSNVHGASGERPTLSFLGSPSASPMAASRAASPHPAGAMSPSALLSPTHSKAAGSFSPRSSRAGLKTLSRVHGGGWRMIQSHAPSVSVIDVLAKACTASQSALAAEALAHAAVVLKDAGAAHRFFRMAAESVDIQTAANLCAAGAAAVSITTNFRSVAASIRALLPRCAAVVTDDDTRLTSPTNANANGDGGEVGEVDGAAANADGNAVGKKKPLTRTEASVLIVRSCAAALSFDATQSSASSGADQTKKSTDPNPTKKSTSDENGGEEKREEDGNSMVDIRGAAVEPAARLDGAAKQATVAIVSAALPLIPAFFAAVQRCAVHTSPTPPPTITATDAASSNPNEKASDSAGVVDADVFVDDAEVEAKLNPELLLALGQLLKAHLDTALTADGMPIDGVLWEASVASLRAELMSGDHSPKANFGAAAVAPNKSDDPNSAESGNPALGRVLSPTDEFDQRTSGVKTPPPKLSSYDWVRGLSAAKAGARCLLLALTHGASLPLRFQCMSAAVVAATALAGPAGTPGASSAASPKNLESQTLGVMSPNQGGRRRSSVFNNTGGVSGAGVEALRGNPAALRLLAITVEAKSVSSLSEAQHRAVEIVWEALQKLPEHSIRLPGPDGDSIPVAKLHAAEQQSLTKIEWHGRAAVAALEREAFAALSERCRIANIHVFEQGHLHDRAEVEADFAAGLHDIAVSMAFERSTVEFEMKRVLSDTERDFEDAKTADYRKKSEARIAELEAKIKALDTGAMSSQSQSPTDAAGVAARATGGGLRRDSIIRHSATSPTPDTEGGSVVTGILSPAAHRRASTPSGGTPGMLLDIPSGGGSRSASPSLGVTIRSPRVEDRQPNSSSEEHTPRRAGERRGADDHKGGNHAGNEGHDDAAQPARHRYGSQQSLKFSESGDYDSGEFTLSVTDHGAAVKNAMEEVQTVPSAHERHVKVTVATSDAATQSTVLDGATDTSPPPPPPPPPVASSAVPSASSATPLSVQPAVELTELTSRFEIEHAAFDAFYELNQRWTESLPAVRVSEVLLPYVEATHRDVTLSIREELISLSLGLIEETKIYERTLREATDQRVADTLVKSVAELETHEGSISDLRGEISRKQNAKDRAEGHFNQAAKDIHAHRDNAQTMTQTIIELRATDVRRGEENARLVGEVHDLKTALQLAEKKLESQKTEIVRVQEEQKAAVDDAVRARSEAVAVEEATNKRALDLGRHMDDLKRQLAAAEQRSEEVAESAEKECARIQEWANRTIEDHTAGTKDIREIADARDAAIAGEAHAIRELQSVEAKVRDLEAEIELHHDVVENGKSKIQSAEKRKEKALEDLDGALKKVDSMMLEIQRMVVEMHTVQGELTLTKDSLDAVRQRSSEQSKNQNAKLRELRLEIRELRSSAASQNGDGSLAPSGNASARGRSSSSAGIENGISGSMSGSVPARQTSSGGWMSDSNAAAAPASHTHDGRAADSASDAFNVQGQAGGPLREDPMAAFRRSQSSGLFSQESGSGKPKRPLTAGMTRGGPPSGRGSEKLDSAAAGYSAFGTGASRGRPGAPQLSEPPMGAGVGAHAAPPPSAGGSGANGVRERRRSSSRPTSASVARPAPSSDPAYHATTHHHSTSHQQQQPATEFASLSPEPRDQGGARHARGSPGLESLGVGDGASQRRDYPMSVDQSLSYAELRDEWSALQRAGTSAVALDPRDRYIGKLLGAVRARDDDLPNGPPNPAAGSRSGSKRDKSKSKRDKSATGRSAAEDTVEPGGGGMKSSRRNRLAAALEEGARYHDGVGHGQQQDLGEGGPDVATVDFHVPPVQKGGYAYDPATDPHLKDFFKARKGTAPSSKSRSSSKRRK